MALGAYQTQRSAEGRTGGSVWRAHAEVLYQYLRRDMRDALAERRRLYPKSHGKQVLRTVPLVQRVARELATLYLRAPARTWEGPPPAQTERIARVYRGAQVDRACRAAHECVVAVGSATIWVWPVPVVGGVRLLVPPPHDQEVILADATSGHERDVAMWRLRLPVGPEGEHGGPAWGVAEVTPSTAIWAEGPLQGQGLWSADGSNPIGEVPVVMLRGGDPAPGEWWSPVPEDLLHAQRAIIHDLTDVGQIARLQGYSQPVVTGARVEDAVELGPETAIRISDTEGSFAFASPSPDLAGYVGQVEQYVRTVIAMTGLNPATFLKSSGITALAKQIELHDRDGERQRHVLEFARAEGRLYSLIQSWVRVLRAEIWADAEVRVDYREPLMPVDPLHTAQGLQIEIALGLTSPARERARRDGISLDEARRRCEEDLADSAAFGLGAGETRTPSEAMADMNETAADDAPDVVLQ